jgi:hypothetical protein
MRCERGDLNAQAPLLIRNERRSHSRRSLTPTITRMCHELSVQRLANRISGAAPEDERPEHLPQSWPQNSMSCGAAVCLGIPAVCLVVAKQQDARLSRQRSGQTDYFNSQLTLRRHERPRCASYMRPLCAPYVLGLCCAPLRRGKLSRWCFSLGSRSRLTADQLDGLWRTREI